MRGGYRKSMGAETSNQGGVRTCDLPNSSHWHCPLRYKHDVRSRAIEEVKQNCHFCPNNPNVTASPESFSLLAINDVHLGQ